MVSHTSLVMSFTLLVMSPLTSLVMSLIDSAPSSCWIQDTVSISLPWPPPPLSRELDVELSPNLLALGHGGKPGRGHDGGHGPVVGDLARGFGLMVDDFGFEVDHGK